MRKGKNEVLFSTEDKLHRTISLTSGTYSHIVKHAELGNHVDLIKDCIENPNIIVQDSGHYNRDDYQKEHGDAKLRKIKGRFLNVVVSVDAWEDKGHVVTAFYIGPN
jgi:hypothetical protein